MKRQSTLKDVIAKGKYVTNGEWYKTLLKPRKYETKNGQPIVSPALCVTEAGELLKIYKKNRVINNGHSKKIGVSVTTLANILRQVVVVKFDNDYFIADGQHLHRWLISENMPVEFILCEVSEEKQLIDFMRLMNSSSKRWGLTQFVNVSTNDKKANAYNKLVEFIETYEEKTGITIKVMSALMYNEAYYNEGASSKAITEDYFVQNVPDVRLKQKLNSLKRFYRVTKMTPTNYLNAAFFTLLYEKRDNYDKNEKNFLKAVEQHAKKYNLLTLKYGNREDAKDMLNKCWAKI